MAHGDAVQFDPRIHIRVGVPVQRLNLLTIQADRYLVDELIVKQRGD